MAAEASALFASRVDFPLGPAQQGARRLQSTWTPLQFNVIDRDPASLSDDGTVTGLRGGAGVFPVERNCEGFANGNPRPVPY